MTEALWKFVRDEWYFFFPLLFMSMSGMCLLIWRVLLNMNAKTKMDVFLPAFQAVLGKEGIEGARKLCASQTGLIPRKLFVAGLDNAKQGPAAMRRAMANTIELEILPELNFLLAPILAIAKIATMVGLLLTVVSMIQTFSAIQKVQESGSAGGVGGQAGAIGLALFATAMGLLTAIPLVFSHVMFKDRIHHFELLMKSAGQKLINLVQNLKTSPPGATPAATAAPGSAKPAAPAAEVATAKKDDLERRATAR
ncbi:MAG TPA: MotA/TolQ/ExbB proton channel family protein [Gemmataceae bacterium]|jgi:biopolymer transport protein ExbB|nr:MotA/TolQ/ExbB proton channel family protein [Gemmataceae bacterium]